MEGKTVNRRLNQSKIQRFRGYLCSEEKSSATVGKYMHDIGVFFEFLGGRQLNKSEVLDYKCELLKRYAVTSANSMLAAINAFFRYLGWMELCVKQYKIQRSAFATKEKELSRDEYVRLIQAAANGGNERLKLIIQTICATGIRVSELQFITVEAARCGETSVNCKGKNRRIFIVSRLCKKLLQYAKKRGEHRGRYS